METFKVFGKLKRKELSFGFNDVRGVNKREDRLLRSALGSLEKQRKRSLLYIQNEMDDLHITLKETNTIWQGDGHPVQDQVLIQAPKCQTPTTSNKKTKKGSKAAEKQNNSKENVQGSNPKEVSESSKDSLAPKSSLQHVNISTANTSSVKERILRRPRNTSTGTLPKNMMQDETAHTFLDLNSRKISNTTEYRLANEASTTLMATGGTTLITNELAYREHHPRSVSSENITLSREKLSPAPFFTPPIRQKKLSVELGSLSSISSSSPRDSPIPTRKMGKARSLTSFWNVGSAESSPIPTRRATVADRYLGRSVVGHKPVARMISCPQLTCSPRTNEFRTLSSISGERSFSRMSTELPELMTAQKIHDGKREENDQENYRCVSPNNLERNMMDKNLQSRINAFLNSLAENEPCENDTCVEDIE